MKEIKPNEIVYFNRYNIPVYFKDIGNNQYLVTVKCNYVSYSSNEKDELTSWDPEGGPFLSIGNSISYYLNGIELKIITKKGLIITYVEKNSIKENTKTSKEIKSKKTKPNKSQNKTGRGLSAENKG